MAAAAASGGVVGVLKPHGRGHADIREFCRVPIRRTASPLEGVRVRGVGFLAGDCNQSFGVLDDGTYEGLRALVEGTPRPLRPSRLGVGAVGHFGDLDVEREVEVEILAAKRPRCQLAKGRHDAILRNDPELYVEIRDVLGVGDGLCICEKRCSQVCRSMAVDAGKVGLPRGEGTVGSQAAVAV